MAKTFTLTSEAYSGRYMQLSCTQTTDIANNKSTINWTLSSLGGSSNYYQTGPTTVTIAGSQVYYCKQMAWDTKQFPAAKGSVSGSIVVNHDTNGNLTIGVSMSTSIYTGVVKNYSSNWTLDSIPRKAVLTSVPDFTDVDNPSISFSNPGGFKMNVWLEPNPVGDHLCIRENIPNTGTYTWVLTDAEREALRSKCKGKTCTIRVGLYSYVGGVEYADYKDKTYTMTENSATKPSVEMTVTCNNGNLPSTFNGIYIQGKTKLDISLSATGKHNSSVKSYWAVADGKTYSGNKITTDVIQRSGNVSLVGYAKDSREFTGASATKSFGFQEYSKPLVVPIGGENAILCYRSDGNGKRTGTSTSVWIKAARSYHKVVSGSQKNFCSLQWRRKLSTEEWNDSVHKWSDLIAKSSLATDEYNAMISGVVFDLHKSYTVQIRAIDDIGEVDPKTLEVPTRDVALHLGIGGKNVSIGTYCDYAEDYTFYSDWKAIFDKEVVIGGLPVVDHIVERGTSGIWTYEKLASGVAKCWAKVSYTVPLSATGVKASVQLNQPFPIAFKDLPFCNLTLANQTTWNQVLSSVDFTATQLNLFSVYRMGAGADITAGGTADIRVIGHWK